MSKYYGVNGKKVGKIGGEKYYIDKGDNIVQKSNKYYPVNSTLIKREKFKEYVLSLFDIGIPQIYVLEELPEDLYPYALIFIQNEEETSIYVDKEEKRTKINIESEEKYDAVDIVNEVPEEPRDNTVYFVNDEQVNKNKKENENLDCDIYVCDNNELRKVTIKDPDVDLIKEVIEEIKTKSLANVYNANLAINELVSTDGEGKLKASGINSTTASTVVNGVNTKSLKNIYNTTLTADRLVYSDDNGYVAASDIVKSQAKEVVTSVRGKCLGVIYNQTLNKNKILMSNSQGNVYTSSIDVTTANDVISNIPNKSLKYGYNNTFSANQTVITDNAGCLIAGRISAADMDDVVSGVKSGSIKNIYDSTLTADRLMYTDNNGCLAVSDLAKSTTKTVVDAVTTKFLSSTYNTNLTANKMLGSNGSGKLYATGIDTSTANNVITGISTKSFKNVYNTTITANKLLCTDGTGVVTTTNKYTVAAPLEMYSNKIELGQVFDTNSGLAYWKIGIDVYGRVSARQAVNMVEILGYIPTDRGSVTINTPSNNCALFFLNTHAGNFYLAQICINTNSGYRRVFEILKTSSAYGLPQVIRNSDTNVTIVATGNCRAVIFTFNTAVT